VSQSFKRKLAAAGAVSAILLALTRIGVTPVAPGLNTGLKQVMPCKAGALCLETDAGDPRVLVKLRFTPTHASLDGWRADLSNGTRLDVHRQTTRGGGPLLVIARADSAAALAKFVWPGGVALRVWHDRAPLPDLESWRVIPDKEGYDSSGRERWRTIWFGLSLVLLIAGIWAAVLEALDKKGPTPAPTPWTIRALSEELIRLTIAGVAVDGPQETALVQRLLTDILLGTLTVRQAMDQAAPGLSRARQQQLFLLARSRFGEQWKKVISLLADHGNQLN
jgi:hypothetical protein